MGHERYTWHLVTCSEFYMFSCWRHRTYLGSSSSSDRMMRTLFPPLSLIAEPNSATCAGWLRASLEHGSSLGGRVDRL